MPTPADLDRLLRDAATVLAALYPGCTRVRIELVTFDGQPAVLPVPGGRWVPFAARLEEPTAPPVDKDDDGLSEKELLIVNAIRTAGHALTTPEIALALGVSPDNGALKRRLAKMVAGEILAVQPGGGYQISDEFDD